MSGAHADGPTDAGALRALVSLLDDPNRAVAAECARRVLELGDAAAPYLREASAAGGTLGLAADDVLADLGRARADLELIRAATRGGLDLETGAFLLARTAYPDVHEAAYRLRLDAYADRLAPRVDPTTEPHALALELSVALGGGEGLRGNFDDYYDPDNSFLNRVLDRHVGIPVSLSAVYLMVARRLGLPVFPIAMPSHFIVQVGHGARVFLDAFSGGRILRRVDCEAFLQQLGLTSPDEHLVACDDRTMLARMAANLAGLYARRRDDAKRERYARLQASLQAGSR